MEPLVQGNPDVIALVSALAVVALGMERVCKKVLLAFRCLHFRRRLGASPDRAQLAVELGIRSQDVSSLQALEVAIERQRAVTRSQPAPRRRRMVTRVPGRRSRHA